MNPSSNSSLVTVNTMTLSLTIKEDACNNMFHDKCQALVLVTKNQEMVRKANNTLKEAEDKQIESAAKLDTAIKRIDYYKHEVECLNVTNIKLQDKLDQEIKNSIGNCIRTGMKI